MSDKITLFQTDRIWNNIQLEIFELVDKEHRSGRAQGGELVYTLENKLANQFNRKHCITTANCSDALTIALISLNLPQNSKVAVGNYTFTASAHAIARAGYKVSPVDVNHMYCVDTLKLTDEVALVAVDIFGNMCNLNNVNIPVIVDAAQSLESYNGTVASAARGVISCISFSPSKTISCWGSGGAILTDDDDLAAVCRKLRLHGKTKNNDDAIHPGLNSMLSSFEAAAVLVGLQYSPQWLARRTNISNYLIAESIYKSGNDTTLSQNTFHKLVFQSNNRTMVQKNFANLNIECPVHYSRLINDESLYKTNNSMTTSDYLKEVSFTVPNQHTLTDYEVERIAIALK